MENKFDEEDILNQYPNVKLHEIEKNRICLSMSQLKNILNIFDKDFNYKFIDLCEKRMSLKENKSLDFFDVFNIMYEALDYVKIKTKYRYEIQVDPNEDFDPNDFSFKNVLKKQIK